MSEVGSLTGYTGLYKLYRRFRGLDMCVCDVVLMLIWSNRGVRFWSLVFAVLDVGLKL